MEHFLFLLLYIIAQNGDFCKGQERKCRIKAGHGDSGPAMPPVGISPSLPHSVKKPPRVRAGSRKEV
jgi:hypothetical protein